METACNDSTAYNESKLFLGGLSWDTTEDDIKNYFNKFGQVVDVSIKYDSVTGNPRGFGFITFGTNECIDNVLKNGPHTLKNKVIDPKRAKSRPICKKIFVGGVDANTAEEEIRRYFGRYGKIEGVELPYDRQRSKRREFCFIIFDTEESADAACKEPKQQIDGRECDVKKAQPQPVAQQQKRMQQQNQNHGHGSYNPSYNSYEEGSGSNRSKKRTNSSNPSGNSSSAPSSDPTWNYNGNYSYGSYDQYGYSADPSQYAYGYPGYAADYSQYYDYYGYGQYGYEGYDLSALQGQADSSKSTSQIQSKHSSSSSHHHSSNHHRDSSDRKSSRKGGSSSNSFHPYKSNSSH